MPTMSNVSNMSAIRGKLVPPLPPISSLDLDALERSVRHHPAGATSAVSASCGLGWRDGWGHHVCHLTAGHGRLRHRCRCDQETP